MLTEAPASRLILLSPFGSPHGAGVLQCTVVKSGGQ